MKIAPAAIAAMLLVGCATSKPTMMVWTRTDGQPIEGNASLTQQFDVDRTICVGEVQKAKISDFAFTSSDLPTMVAQIEDNQSAYIVYRGCMAERGYIKARKS